MACFEARLDAKDFNTIAQTVGQLLYPGTGTKVYCIWSGRASAGGASLHNREVMVNWFDWSTKGVGTPVQIEPDGGNNLDYLVSTILSDGTFICGYGTGMNGLRAKESTDQGATWPTSADVGGTFGSVTLPNWRAAGMVSFGTDCWFFLKQIGGSNNGDLYAFKRTAAGVWDGGTRIHDGTSGTGPAMYPDVSALSGVRQCVMKDATHGVIVMDFIGAGDTSPKYVVALPTTDGWGSLITPVTVKSFASASNRTPNALIGTDGRVRMSWSDETLSVTQKLPVLAYSDDVGKTWTIVGSPPPFTAAAGLFSWDPSFDRAMFLGAQNTWYMGCFDNSAGVTHHLFRGGDVLTGWTDDTCTGLSYGTATASSGDGFIGSGQWFRLFTRVNGGVDNVNILWKENADTGGGGTGPPLVESSPFGQDSANIYLRNELRVNRGWSAHDLPVSAWMHWFEGDYTTQRRKPVLCAANPIMDPRMQDPAVIPAIWKVDDENRFTIESFVSNGDGTYAQAGYPVEFEWRSSEMDLTGDFASNVLRAVILKYRRPTTTFDVEIWVDSKIAQVTTVPPAWPEPGQRFIALNAFANTGNRVQLRVRDRSEYNLIIESWAPIYIPKRVRGTQ